MGNCLGSPLADPSPSSVKNPSTTGPSRNSYSTTTTDFSATSSSFGKSQFSAAVSEGSVEINPNGEILESPHLKVFTFADLRSATKNFKSDTLLGEGGFGRVFKGWVDERTLAPARFGTGMAVAIKKLNSESMQGLEEWQSEVNFLGRLSHPNLVKLLGYCWEDTELLLVYEYMQRGSLENHLFRRNPTIEPLSWDIRLKILIGAGRGLAFLHTSDKEVIYRDFKASNILLDGVRISCDPSSAFIFSWVCCSFLHLLLTKEINEISESNENYNAKISDFGLAKLGPSGEATHVTTRIMGTYGYAAPEYIATGHLYVKSDVYGFGVVLLEMLTGLRALDKRRPTGQQNLVEWMRPIMLHKKKFKAMMDARIENQYSTKAMLQAAELTVKCLENDPKDRPAMKEVVEVLEEIDGMKKPKATKSTFGNIKNTNHRQGQQPGHHRPTSKDHKAS